MSLIETPFTPAQLEEVLSSAVELLGEYRVTLDVLPRLDRDGVERARALFTQAQLIRLRNSFGAPKPSAQLAAITAGSR